MPKIIENLKASILEVGKFELLEKGYSGLTIRGIADSCHIAVGTLYNYFPSKKMLIANIMLKDWNSSMENLENELTKTPDSLNGFHLIFAAIKDYTEVYRPIWCGYSGDGLISNEMHLYVVNHIMKLVSLILDQSKERRDPDLCRFISEVLIHAGCREDATFEGIGVFLTRLI